MISVRCQDGWAHRGTATEQSTSFHLPSSLAQALPSLKPPWAPPHPRPCLAGQLQPMKWTDLGHHIWEEGCFGETQAKPFLSHREMGAPYWGRAPAALGSPSLYTCVQISTPQV